MIRTVADFLHQLKEAEVGRLDEVDLQHGPTIGDMYEGLSADLLKRAIPPQLGLQLVNGFVSDGLGSRSGQIDCMLVRGEGKPIPYTDAFEWPVKDVIAVLEIKKTLYHADLVDSFDKLRRVKDLDREYKISLRGEVGTVDVRSGQRAFAETTGLVAPPYDKLDSLPFSEQLILHTLVSESLAPVGIVLGYHGYASEKAFRDSLLSHLQGNLTTKGFGPGSFPQLMISGRYSLGKANGQPFSARMHEGWWPFYFSTRVSPVLMLLEYVWTRLDLEFGIGGLWGEDLSLERRNPFLLTQGAEQNGVTGWHLEWVDLSEDDLASAEEFEPWEPEELSHVEFVVITWLCNGNEVHLDDHEFLDFLAGEDVAPEDLKARLVQTGLVAMSGAEIELITTACMTAVLDDGRLVAGENNTGRFERWMAKHLATEGGEGQS